MLRQSTRDSSSSRGLGFNSWAQMRWDLQSCHFPRSPGKGLRLSHQPGQLPGQPLMTRSHSATCPALVMMKYCCSKGRNWNLPKEKGSEQYISSPPWGKQEGLPEEQPGQNQSRRKRGGGRKKRKGVRGKEGRKETLPC